MHMGMTKLCILLFFLLERCRLLAFADFLDDAFYMYLHHAVQYLALCCRQITAPNPGLSPRPLPFRLSAESHSNGRK